MIVGYFLEKEELEKLRVFEDVIREAEVPARNSCEHLPAESYTKGNPKYCPECGKKVQIHPMEPAIYTKELTGYYKNFFHPKSNSNRIVCDCLYECEKCEYNCERTKHLSQRRCKNCFEEENNCICPGVDSYDETGYESVPKPYPDLSDSRNYVSPKCNENIYSNRSYKNYFVLSNGEKLIFITGHYRNEDIFCIYYAIEYSFILVDEELLAFKEKVGKFLEERNLPLCFGIRSIE